MKCYDLIHRMCFSAVRISEFIIIPLNCRRTKVIPLRCKAPVDFDFQLSFVQHHPAYTVTPMSGIIPAYGQVDITVTFAPTEFNTAVMKLQLVISQFNSTPSVCTFIGTSTPGLAQWVVEEIKVWLYTSNEVDFIMKKKIRNLEKSISQSINQYVEFENRRQSRMNIDI